MKITFGAALDGVQRSIKEPALNEVTCGIVGLASLLELRLGLATPSASPAHRVVNYERALINTAVGRQCFFSRSLVHDSFAVAETLLSWRDELRLAGWRGDAVPEDPPRLHDLAAVEQLASTECASGLGDRLQTILAELDTRSVKVDSIEVVDDAGDLPGVLRQILERLGATFACRPAEPSATDGSDLRMVQELIAGGSTAKLAWRGDDSILALTAFSEVTLANATAQLVKKARADGTDIFLVGSGNARPVETALIAFDEPVTPLSDYSSNRPILGVLALALRLRWQPLDPGHLLEFLTHPVGPLRRGLRQSLARVVAEFPGIGCEAWNDAIASWRTRIEAETQGDAASQHAALTRFNEDVALWLNLPRFDISTGASGVALAETCARVAAWAAARAATTESPAELSQFSATANHATELGDVLREMPNVTQPVLDRLLGQIGAIGTTSGETVAEVGRVPHVALPGAVIDKHDIILWWAFHRGTVDPISPWTHSQREALARRGVKLLSQTMRLNAANAAAARALLSARQRLVLFIPKQRGNEALAHHPLHDRLDAYFDGGLPVLDLDAEVTNGCDWLQTDTMVRRQLSPLRRWWKLPDGSRLMPRAKESFSSAHQFIYDPFAWALKYAAQLRPGVLASIDESRQRGNLLHRVVERLFGAGAQIDWRTATQPEFHTWLDTMWSGLIETEGANYLVRGRQTDGERLRAEARWAVWNLICHLREAGVTHASVKVCPPEIPFGAGTFGGEIDLEVEAPPARRAVIDLKYGQLKPKRAELEQNIQLQLAVYGFLESAANGGAWPEGAYYILRRGLLLAQDRNLFPSAVVVAPKTQAVGLSACWQRFETVWAWRRAQIDGGWLELPLEGTTPSDGSGAEPSSTPPSPEWTKDVKMRRFDDFTALTGWRIDQ